MLLNHSTGGTGQAPHALPAEHSGEPVQREPSARHRHAAVMILLSSFSPFHKEHAGSPTLGPSWAAPLISASVTMSVTVLFFFSVLTVRNQDGPIRNGSLPRINDGAPQIR